MDLLREYFWLFIVVGIVLFSVIIAVIFILINKCISKKAQEYETNSHENLNHRYYSQSSQYHPKHLEDELPPLPARNIPSYNAQECKRSFQTHENQRFNTQPSDYSPKHLTKDLPSLPASNRVSTSYEDIPSLPDYIKVEEKTPPPPYKHYDPSVMFTTALNEHDRASMDSYDDVQSPGHESEDYDDVG